MSKEKFTQGEWSAVKGDTYCAIRSDNKVVADLRTVSGIYSKADAHLIAAAPDMYRMLKDMEGFLEAMRDMPADWTIRESQVNHNIIRKLLAKARGE